MFALSLSSLVLSTVFALVPVQANNDGKGQTAGLCKTVDFTIALNATTADIPIPPPASQAELTGSLVQALSPTAEHPQFELKQTVGNYSISTLVCVPENFDGRVVNLALHGLGYTKSYWDVPLNDSLYSFAEAAAKRGEATFAYDRLGAGNSTRQDGELPDAIQDVQIFTHVEVAKLVADLAREYFQNPKTLVGVGHSYGSLTLAYLAAQYPDAVDALALTGFSADPESYSGRSAFALNVAIANEAYPESFNATSYSNAYLVSGNEIADLTAFFAFPGYEQSAVEWSTSNKGTIAYGELLTFGPPTFNSTTFTGSVLALSGSADFIFCSSDCNKDTAPVAGLQTFFPNTTDFSTVIVEGTGHALNLHVSAQEAYGKYGEWVQRIAA